MFSWGYRGGILGNLEKINKKFNKRISNIVCFQISFENILNNLYNYVILVQHTCLNSIIIKNFTYLDTIIFHL